MKNYIKIARPDHWIKNLFIAPGIGIAILLLDDFMSELDKTRRKNFLENIEGTQVIITGTEKLDIENLEYLEYK